MNVISRNLIIFFTLLSILLVHTLFQASEPVNLEVIDSFKADCAQLAKNDRGLTIVGDDGWLFSKNELRHIGVGEFWGNSAGMSSRAKRVERRDPLPAIIDFKERLDHLGIELIFLPIPPKAIVYPDKISETIGAKYGKDSPRLDFHHQLFYRILRDKGVNVIDLVPEFLANRYDQKGYLYCKTDTHWSGLASIRATKLIALELKNKAWMKDIAKKRFDSEYRTVPIKGDLLRDLQEKEGIADEKLELRFVGTRTSNGLKPVELNPDSPVILMADSHGLIFHAGGDMLAHGAGLADQLALDLGFPVDLIAVRGSGATPARVNLYRRAKREGYLSKKKVLIWCISAREFTESIDGWAKVPVMKKTNPESKKN
jgi:alginate O-acetyltransferase complex protein AlgJ